MLEITLTKNGMHVSRPSNMGTVRNNYMQLTEQQLNDFGEKSKRYLSPYITTITGASTNKNVPAKYIGTSAYINYNGHTYIASAQHVANKIFQFEYLFHGVGNQNYPIQGHYVATTVPNADFCVMGCFEELLSSKEKVLDFETEKFMSNHSKDAYYMVMGYPGKLHFPMDFINLHQHVLTSVITRLKGINPNKNGDNILFDPHYPNSLVEPQGMSGSPVWNLNFHLEDDLENWSVEKISFAGIVTRWDKNSQSLIATDSELIKQVLPHVTKKFRQLYPRTDK